MKILQILDWAALALGAFNATCMAVVCLALWANRGRAAELGANLEPLLIMTGLLTGLAVIAAGAVGAVRQQSRWHWPLQVLLLTCAVFAVSFTPQLA